VPAAGKVTSRIKVMEIDVGFFMWIGRLFTSMRITGDKNKSPVVARAATEFIHCKKAR
jgi:hypothetical protein